MSKVFYKNNRNKNISYIFFKSNDGYYLQNIELKKQILTFILKNCEVNGKFDNTFNNFF